MYHMALRVQDLRALIFGSFRKAPGGYEVEWRQQKTSSDRRALVGEEAHRLLRDYQKQVGGKSGDSFFTLGVRTLMIVLERHMN